jgi:hypothetical protein
MGEATPASIEYQKRDVRHGAMTTFFKGRQARAITT